jgi:serine/threonine protein kinase
MIKGFKK